MIGRVSTLKIEKDSLHVSRDEGLRYIGYRKQMPVEEIEKRADKALEQLMDILDPRVCYLETPVVIDKTTVDFGVLQVESEGLARHLAGCCKAYLFAATTGGGVDRIISRYSRLSVMDGLLYDAMGSAAIEGLCDKVCEIFEEKERNQGYSLRSRFSPGYGGLAIETQKDFLQVLDTNRKIGLTLTEGMMMAPVKSVSAIVGVSRRQENRHHEKGCASCEMTDCPYRKEA